MEEQAAAADFIARSLDLKVKQLEVRSLDSRHLTFIVGVFQHHKTVNDTCDL